MVSDKESIERLVRICQMKDLEHVIISPGSRNAPLVISFDNNPHFTCYNIPDERVAGFFALGLALRTGKPAILCCTSGSAVLNYAPAVAEAYYQKIPMIVCSADRPSEWVDQRAGQTLRQYNAFANYIKRSFQFFEEAKHPDHLWYNDRITNEAIDTSMIGPAGPVHINIPLREPLYSQVPSYLHIPKVVNTLVPQKDFDENQWDFLTEQWNQAERVLILCGQGAYAAKLTDLINRVVENRQAVVLTECTSNIGCPGPIQCIDRTIESIDTPVFDRFTPDLLITMGGAVVSKRIRYLFRAMEIAQHWHIDESDFYMDTYKALTLNVPVAPSAFFEKVLRNLSSSRDEEFYDSWEARSSDAKEKHTEFIKSSPWSDLLAFDAIIRNIPERSAAFFANSTPIRYAQLFDQRLDISYHSNRGVSGIDGCTSTAVGFSQDHDDLTIIITGDVAFFYDSNAVWHHHLSPRLRIVLINNQGGGIFRYIPGPSSTNQLEEHFEAHHTVTAAAIAATHGLIYYEARNKNQLEERLAAFFHRDQSKAVLLEVHTPREINDDILRSYFQNLKQ